jgi:hypothetical protein
VNDRPSQTYTCQNLGCPNGYQSTFTAAPEAWFYEKNMLLPKNCPDCKSWIEAQQDQALRCGSCSNSIRIPKRYKISHHKKIGSYQTPEQCKSCAQGKRQPKTAQKLPRRTKVVRPAPKKRDDFASIRFGIQVQPRAIAANAEYYQKLVPDGSETRRLHLEHHMAGSPHSQVGQIIRNRPKPQTRTAVVGATVAEFDLLIAALDVTFSSADPSRMREYSQGRRIVRLTLLDGDQIESTVIEPIRDTGLYEVITTFDEVTIQDALNEYGRQG